MVLRSYYRNGSLTGLIEVKHLVNSLPAVYTLFVSHDINGVLIKQEFPNIEKAMSKASTFGCVKSNWSSKETLLKKEE